MTDNSGRTENAPPPPGTFRRVEFLEVAVFLFLILPAFLFAPLALKEGDFTFLQVAAGTIFQQLSLTALVLFFLWRNREPLSTVGLTHRGVWREMIMGCALFLPFILSISLAETLLRKAGFSLPSEVPAYLRPAGHGQIGLALVLLVVVAFSEELIFRGYLLKRFESLTGSIATAAFLSAAVFSLGHGYQGATGTLLVGIVGLVFAAIYWWRGSLVPVMVMHFLLDFMSLILIPMNS